MGPGGSEDVSSNAADDAVVMNGFIKHFMDEAIAEKDELHEDSSIPLVLNGADTDGTGAMNCSVPDASLVMDCSVTNGTASIDCTDADASISLSCFGSDATDMITCSDGDTVVVMNGSEGHATLAVLCPQVDPQTGTLKEAGNEEQVDGKQNEEDIVMTDPKPNLMDDRKPVEGVDVVESAGSDDTEDAISDSNEVIAADNGEPPKGDSAKVKKPLAPFLLFSKEQRPLVKKDHPDASFKDMNVLLGEKWKNVSDGEKKAYEARYQVEKEVYLKNLQNTVQEAKAPRKSEARSRRKERDPDKPKHQITAFFAFGNVRRPALLADKISVPEIGKILGDEWKNMDEEARCQYEKIAAQDKIRYATELEAYKKKKEEEALALKKQMEERKAEFAMQASKLYKQKDKMHLMTKLLKEDRTSQRKRSKVDDEPGKPKKPQTAYLLFGHEVRQAALKENPSLSFVDINTIVSTKWRELVEDEKQKWLDKAAAATEQYKSDLGEYYAKRRGVTESSTGS
eukprot:TRINITY_DN16810_c0_g1_i2.p1 TRINITY_DN16810_c0_g1~~TRINITY_DN16810_c0_g1_i2.p1  ORF type:complete len:512 (+),score=129.69 TRINITY_DN16810_c0_g1_i2:394-1929(+)